MIMKKLLFLFIVCTVLATSCKKDKPGKLATITTTAVTNITSTGVTSGGTISDDGNSGITQRGIAWATHTSPTVGDSITNSGSGPGPFISILSTLNAKAVYYIRAYAINATGTAYGNEITFTTSNGLATISTTAISDIQPLSAKSGGNITNDGGATITERGVVYATTVNPTTTNFKITTGTGTGTFVSTLSPLSSQQTYYVRAYAINSFGTAYGNQVQFNAASANTVTDIDGNVYPYITLCGGKSWMATNLKVTKYRNGDPITNGLTGFDWTAYPHASGAYSFPNGITSTKDTFGLLYNILAVNDSRGVCPIGWHIPTDLEWKSLEICHGMSQADADATGYRGTIGTLLLEGGSSGLNLQKAGYISISSGSYLRYNQWGLFWSSSYESGPDANWYRGFSFQASNPASIYRLYNSYGMSVRCVKD
jgi:uncharacterized protein (TIGR02145 family)